MERIYMDNAATTALYAETADAMAALSKEIYGNPSSRHAEGMRAAKLLAGSREKLALLLGSGPEEMYFTSGGTESDNLAVFGALNAGRGYGKNHIVASSIEHPAVLNAVKGSGAAYTLVAPDASGRVSVLDIEKAIRKDTALVSVMYANNETGVIQPVKEIADLCRKRGVLFHTDAVQAAGHTDINAHLLGADMISLSAHKFHGPKGAGALYIRRGVNIDPAFSGGGQENGVRPGTQDIIGAFGMAESLGRSLDGIAEKSARISGLRETLENALSKIEGAHFNGASDRLPGITNVSFEGINGASFAALLDLCGIAVSAGAACASSEDRPSRVLIAMGVPESLARGAIRISLSEFNTAAEISAVAGVIADNVRRLRALQQRSAE